MNCPICGSGSTRRVLHRDRVPVLQNRVWRTSAEAKAAPVGRLDIHACGHCEHLWNAAFDADRMRYDPSYDNRQSTSARFREHLEDRLQSLARDLGPGQRVVEIGCGQGEMLLELCQRTGAEGVGFDPACRRPGRHGTVELNAEPFSSESPIGELVVSRHVIEHLVDPVALLSDVARAARSTSTRIAFECPDVAWILQDAVLWDFFYEHVHYFSQRSLRTAFERAGLEVQAHTPVFEGQYQWIEAGLRPSSGKLAEPPSPGDPAQLKRVARSWVAEQRAELAQLRQDGRVALWGAGAKGVTWASWIDPTARLLTGIVDLNPAKQDRYIGATGHPVLSPGDLTAMGVAHVLVMNPAYEAEIRDLVRREHPAVVVHVAAPPRSALCSPSSPSAFLRETVPPTSNVA